MGNRAFHAVVILLWLGTMGWLVVSKVMPTLLVGEPPTYRSTLSPPDEIICWHIHWNGKPTGWAASRCVNGLGGVTEVHSRVVLSELPVEEMTPAWLVSIVRPLLEEMGRVRMDARSRLEIDPLGRLSELRSTVSLGDMEDAIKMSGRVENSYLKLQVRSGQLEYNTQQFLPADGLVGNELSPQAELPNLKLGQTWTTPVFSPFRPNSPPDILQAEVAAEESVMWNGESRKAWLVEYRNDSGAGVGAADAARAKLWVLADGRVIQQEVTILKSRMRFVRMTDEEAALLVESLSEDWLARMDEEKPR